MHKIHMSSRTYEYDYIFVTKQLYRNLKPRYRSAFFQGLRKGCVCFVHEQFSISSQRDMHTQM